MAHLRRRWARPCKALVMGLALLIRPAAPTQAQSAGDRPANQRVVAGRVREVHDALHMLQAAVENEGLEEASDSPAKPPERPTKTITPPTLDAAGVDRMIDKILEAMKAPFTPLTSNEEFIRRASLDVAGKLPTPEQIRTFRDDTSSDKRAKLIDRLLDSPDYARNWARYWRDVIQFHSSNPNPIQTRYAVLEDWLADRLARNTPWDEVATALITANGRNDQDGAVNFTMAQMGQPVELAGEVARIFMGVRIQCAQCHDHPTDPWTREQFHRFAAFFAGTRTNPATQPSPGVIPAFAVSSQPGKPRYTMPDLKDPQHLIPVRPRFFMPGGETIPESLTVDQRRSLAASYVTGQDNPWFARAFVNRIWFALIGYGFSNPVDDLGPDRPLNAPEVLEALASQWQAGGYDVRWLFRTILNTRAYQRRIRGGGNASGSAAFVANFPIRLRSDQLLDALVQVLDLGSLAPAGGGPGGAAATQGEVKRAADAGTTARRFNPRILFNHLFGADPSTPHEEVLGTIPQALFLMNSPLLSRAIKVGKGTMLGAILADHGGDREALEALYLRVLARRPNPEEVKVCRDYIAHVRDRRAAYEDILWNLINSTEFISRR
ncbi:MAG: DUF1549 domain-containing protein [Planctomycetaceae bacterium]|nr:DUF1549 domain-containing protein [Planctomycetaceae bacterium]MBV8318532.1 DUF1549 domain-containing protein [Planctomycetaceae bacterium]